MPALAASASRSGVSSLASIRRQASATAAAWRSARGGRSGRQRRQGRKPAAWAASTLSWKAKFLRKAGRAPKEGRQNTPVLLTEYQKRPSKAASLRWTACQRSSSSEWWCSDGVMKVGSIERSMRRLARMNGDAAWWAAPAFKSSAFLLLNSGGTLGARIGSHHGTAGLPIGE